MVFTLLVSFNIESVEAKQHLLSTTARVPLKTMLQFSHANLLSSLLMTAAITIAITLSVKFEFVHLI